MKKCMLVSLVLLLSASASFAAPNEWDGQLYITGAFGDARDLTYATNAYTVRDGFGFFRMLNHEDTTIQVNNAIKGFIEIDFNNDAYASGINITVIGRDDITNGTNRYDNLTLVQGGTADSETGNFSNARDAFLIDGSQNQSTLTMIEGEYLGGKDTGGGANVFSFEGIQAADLDNLYIYGASGIGGNGGQSGSPAAADMNAYGGMGLFLNDINNVVISNSFSRDDYYFGGDGGTARIKNDNRTAFAYGGEGIYYDTSANNAFAAYNLVSSGGAGGKATADRAGGTAIAFGGNAVDINDGAVGANDSMIAASALINNGMLAGGAGGTATANSAGGSAFASGGHGFRAEYLSESVSMTNSYRGSYGGAGGTASANGAGGTAVAEGGAGISFEQLTTGGRISGNFSGGDGGDASATGEGGTADADGAPAVYVSGSNVTVDDGTYKGANGGDASAGGATASAVAGDGILIRNGSTVTVNGGNFTGGIGGRADATDVAYAYAGFGLQAIDSTVTINDGTFNAGAKGLARATTAFSGEGTSVLAEDSNLSIAGGTFMGDVVHYVSSGSNVSANISGGHFSTLYFVGAGTHVAAFADGATYDSGIVQEDGIVDVNSWGSDALNILVTDGGTMNFNAAMFTLVNGGVLALGDVDSTVSFDGLDVEGNGRLDIGVGQVQVDGNVNVQSNGTVRTIFNQDENIMGTTTISGFMSADPDANLLVTGHVTTRTNVITLATATGGVIGVDTNAVKHQLGWLVKIVDVDTLSGADLDVTLNDRNLAEAVDTTVVPPAIMSAFTNGMTDSVFVTMNDAGQKDTVGALQYSYTQLPDTVNLVLRNNEDAIRQMTARGTDFRSSNGYASVVPKFKTMAAPTGPAGPLDAAEGIKAWARGYGQIATREQDGNFEEYDAQTYGVIIGIDKQLNNMLIGLSGGWVDSSIDSLLAHETDVGTIHGSLYSTIGMEKTYLDMSLTYGRSSTEADTLFVSEEFDSDLYSGYIGGGYSIYLGDRLALIPEAAFQASYYDQEAFDQKSKGGAPAGSVAAYDAWSYMSILGVNLAYLQAIELFDLNMALLPEIRFKWIHEFNSDLDDYTYGFNGTDYTFAVRPRDEELYDVGIGLEMWNWNNERTKVQLDYDFLFSDTYESHTFSARLSHEF